MKNKGKIILIVLVLLLLIGGIFYFTNNNKNKKQNNNSEEKITITFDTDGGSEVEKITVKKGESFTLPTTSKEGYEFLGWYLKDTKYTDEITNSITKDILLTAKWEELDEEKSLVVTFDSKGGNKISNMSFKCTDDAATITNLPKPKRDSYTFVTWEDKFGKSILNGAVITCDGELKLYAVWQKKSSGDNSDAKTYKCPSGYDLKDTNKCVKLASEIKYCDNNWKEVNGECVNPSSPNTKGTRVCPEKSFDGYTTKGVYYEAGRGYCGYVELPSYTGTKSGCENAGGHYVTVNNRCFKYIDISYKVECAKDEKLFAAQVIAPGNGGGCYQVTSMKKKCPDGYTNASVYGECALIEDATY